MVDFSQNDTFFYQVNAFYWIANPCVRLIFSVQYSHRKQKPNRKTVEPKGLWSLKIKALVPILVLSRWRQIRLYSCRPLRFFFSFNQRKQRKQREEQKQQNGKLVSSQYQKFFPLLLKWKLKSFMGNPTSQTFKNPFYDVNTTNLMFSMRHVHIFNLYVHVFELKHYVLSANCSVWIAYLHF